MFMFNALAILTKAQRQSGRNAAWLDVAPYYPKGNNNNGRDINDPSVFFHGSAPAHTGSGTPFAKTTHNGQNCGVTDVNGNIWLYAIGMTCEGTKFFVPKLTTDMARFTHNVKTGANTDEQCAFGDLAYLSNPSGFFEELNITGSVFTSATPTHYVFGKGDAQVFPFSADRNNPHWILSCLGAPLMSGVTQGTSGGTEEFGNDILYSVTNKPTYSVGTLGGGWNNTENAGVFTFAHDCNHTVSLPHGCSRLAIITSQVSALKSSIQSQVSALQSQLSALRSQLSALQGQASNQGQVSALRSQLSALQGQVNSLQGQVRNNQNLQGQVSALQNQLSNLQRDVGYFSNSFWIRP